MLINIIPQPEISTTSSDWTTYIPTCSWVFTTWIRRRDICQPAWSHRSDSKRLFISLRCRGCLNLSHLIIFMLRVCFRVSHSQVSSVKKTLRCDHWWCLDLWKMWLSCATAGYDRPRCVSKSMLRSQKSPQFKPFVYRTTYMAQMSRLRTNQAEVSH